MRKERGRGRRRQEFGIRGREEERGVGEHRKRERVTVEDKGEQRRREERKG